MEFFWYENCIKENMKNGEMYYFYVGSFVVGVNVRNCLFDLWWRVVIRGIIEIWWLFELCKFIVLYLLFIFFFIINVFVNCVG